MGIKELPIQQDIRHNGKIAQLVKRPRKAYNCVECKSPTEIGEPHYTITYGGAGLRNIKFPDRVCVGCIRLKMNLPLTWQDQRQNWGDLLTYCYDKREELESTGRMRGLVICMQKIWGDCSKLKEASLC